MNTDLYHYYCEHTFAVFQEHAKPFIDRLVEQNYEPATIKIYLRCIDRITKAMLSDNLSILNINEPIILKVIAQMGWIPKREIYAKFIMKHFLSFLREQGVGEFYALPSKKEAFRFELCASYKDYLRHQRGLGERTIIGNWRFVEQFLNFCFPEAIVDNLEKITSKDIAGFLHQRVIKRSIKDKSISSHLRNFFRYLFYTGKTKTNLSLSVPRIAQRQRTNLPRHLNAEQVNHILAAVRAQEPICKRNYAMVILLARLGLRPREVIDIKIDDIHWRSGEILIRGKGGRHDKLPLLPDVGEALADYIKSERKTTSRYLFVGKVAPHTPFKDACVLNDILGRAYTTTGLKPPAAYVGSHILRHSLAVNLVHNGASLEEISDTLRHRSRATTLLYTRLDIEGLRCITQSWPVEEGKSS